MQSYNLICAVIITAIAILAFLPTSMGENKRCMKGASECPKNEACVHAKTQVNYCTALAKEGEICTFRKAFKNGVYYLRPPCEPEFVCKKAELYHGWCEKKK